MPLTMDYDLDYVTRQLARTRSERDAARAALQRVKEKVTIIAYATPIDGWIQVAPQFAREIIAVIDAALGQLTAH